MAFGYVIAQITVTDPLAYPDYVAQVQPIIAQFGGEFLASHGVQTILDGVAHA